MTPTGLRVQAVVFETVADLPRFDIEVVDQAGEVVEHFTVLGHAGLMMTAQRRRWKETDA